jgi:hypothetical protein
MHAYFTLTDGPIIPTSNLSGMVLDLMQTLVSMQSRMHTSQVKPKERTRERATQRGRVLTSSVGVKPKLLSELVQLLHDTATEQRCNGSYIGICTCEQHYCSPFSCMHSP